MVKLVVTDLLHVQVGGAGQKQDLMLYKKDEDGNIEERKLLPVAYVPLVKA